MLSIENLKQRGVDSLARLVIDYERENVRLRDEKSRIVQEFNVTLQKNYTEIRNLRQNNQAMLDENQELRELCLYLDDERLRLSKLVEDWQKFGQNTFSNVQENMELCHQEVKQLESMQKSVLKENSELKEFLSSSSFVDGREMLRKGGDGSSSPSPSMEGDAISKSAPTSSAMVSPLFSDSDDSLMRYNQLASQKTIVSSTESHVVDPVNDRNLLQQQPVQTRRTYEVLSNRNRHDNSHNNSSATHSTSFNPIPDYNHRPIDSGFHANSTLSSRSSATIVHQNPFRKVSSTTCLSSDGGASTREGRFNLTLNSQGTTGHSRDNYQHHDDQFLSLPYKPKPDSTSSFGLDRPKQIIGYYPVSEENIKSLHGRWMDGKQVYDEKVTTSHDRRRREERIGFKTAF